MIRRSMTGITETFVIFRLCPSVTRTRQGSRSIGILVPVDRADDDATLREESENIIIELVVIIYYIRIIQVAVEFSAFSISSCEIFYAVERLTINEQ